MSTNPGCIWLNRLNSELTEFICLTILSASNIRIRLLAFCYTLGSTTKKVMLPFEFSSNMLCFIFDYDNFKATLYSRTFHFSMFWLSTVEQTMIITTDING